MADEVPAEISNTADDETTELKALRKRYENWRAELEKEVDQAPQIQQKEMASECCIFNVPKTLKELKDKETEYKPQIVSLGPYHSLRCEPSSTMENKKSEVVRSILTKLDIQGKCFQSRIVEKIKADENSIKRCYDGPMEVDSNILSWMMARDSIFILEFLRQRLLEIHLGNRPKSPQQIRQLMRKNQYIKRKRFGFLIRSMSLEYLRRNSTPEIDSVPVVEIVKDIVKLENQIPLSVIRTILRIEIEIEMENGKAKSGMEISDDGEKSNQDHILTSRVDEELEKLLASMCLLLSPIVKHVEDDTMNMLYTNWRASKHTYWRATQHTLGNMNHILECLRYYVVGSVPDKREAEVSIKSKYCSALTTLLSYGASVLCSKSSKNAPEKSPKILHRSAVELDKAGVKFKPCYGGIREIHFDKRRSTLHLPEIDVEIHTETIMRNMMAFELCSSSCEEKAVTRYAHFMDQLIDCDKDVALLRKYHIINNNLGNDSKVVELWSSLTDATGIPDCPSIDGATEALQDYCRRKRTWAYLLWNEFLEVHCSKPWYVVAFVASALLLLMTALQVLCLFYPCNNITAFGK